MIKDRNKGITNITYNHLNLPKKISFGSLGTIKYIYDAEGAKIQKKVTEASANKTVDYLGGFQYEDENLSFFPTAEGYVKVTETGAVGKVFSYVYNHTDHLGNIRLRYTRDPADQGKVRILEENSYYPFLVPNAVGGGMKHEGYNNEHEIILPPGHLIPYPPVKIMPITPFDTDPYQYKYNGKEYQNDFRLNFYDYGARNYDAALGRWMNVDPLAELYDNYSPYVYVKNTPTRYIDPDGMRIIDPDKIVENHKNSLNQSIENIKSFINKGLISNEIGQKLIGVNKISLKEISKLESSKQTYNVHFDDTHKGGGVSYQMSTNEVMIGIESGSNIGLIGHELKHAYQFETGQISLVADNSKYGSLYDINDETDAYNRERELINTRNFGAISKWNNNDVYEFGKTMTPPAYHSLPSKNMKLKTIFIFFKIYSKEGKRLRDATIESGRLGKPVYEVYKGWRKDYDKGINQNK